MSHLLEYKKRTKKNIKIYILIIALFFGFVLHRSLAVLVVYLLSCTIFLFIYKYSNKELNKNKMTQPIWQDEEIILPLYNKFNFPVFQIVFPLCMAYILCFSVIIDIIYADYSKAHFIILLITYIILSTLLFIYTLQYFKNNHVLYKDGIKIMDFNYPFHSIKKYQFIKLRKGGYIFEGRTKKILISIHLSDENKEILETQLKNAITS